MSATKKTARHQYTAGGWILRMTERMAARWNVGKLGAGCERFVEVYEDTTAQGDRSYLRDGEVVFLPGMPTGHWRRMRQSDWAGQYGLDGEAVTHCEGE